MKKNQNNSEKYLNVLFAIFVSIPALNKILTTIFPLLSGKMMIVLYITTTVLFIYFKFLTNKKISMNRNSFVIGLILVIVYIISNLGEAKVNTNIFEFGVYVLVPLLVYNIKKYDSNVFIKTCVIAPAFGVFWSEKIFTVTYNSIEMGISYAFLLTVGSAIIYFIKINNKHWFVTLCAILDMIYAIKIIMYGSRGAILSLIVELAILITLKENENRWNKKSK